MKYRAILFDMDGTLVPMDVNQFTGGYFKLLYAKLAKYGIAPDAFKKGMWAGVKAMTMNDGSRSNEEAFWEVFSAATGADKDAVNADCLDFYKNEFQMAKQFTGENPLAVEAVRVAREKAEFVALATNPLFPMVGQETRMSWVGLKKEDFDLVTSYEADTTCKPNPAYFLSVAARLGVEPKDCLVIGNDEGEDMYAATLAGMDAWFVTNWMIPNEAHPWNGQRGTFAEMVEMLKGLE